MTIQSNSLVCPRCGGREFTEVDCGPDTYDDDITYTSDICTGCRLWHDGWVDKWLIDVTNWRESEDAEEFKAAPAMTIRQVGPDQFLAEIPMTVPYAAPAREYLLLKDEIDDAMASVLESGRYVGGKVVEAFETEVAAYLGVKYVVAVQSGTQALDLVDSFFEERDLLLPRIVTHWDGMVGVVARHEIEDAAQAFGSLWDGRKAGTHGIAACFSLHPLKTFSVQGGGGLVCTNEHELDDHVRRARGHGLDAIQCAVGRVKLRHIDGFLKRKQEIARRYTAELPEGYRRPDYDYPSNYPVPDNGLRKKLADSGVETLPGNFPNTINLPLHAHMTEEEICHVIAAVRASAD